MARAKVTTNHDEISEWAAVRGGRPAAVGSTYSSEDPGLLRIVFPDAPDARDDALVEISWDEFFEKFDEANLALVFEEETAGGQRSNFNKLINRETAEARLHGESHGSRHTRR